MRNRKVSRVKKAGRFRILLTSTGTTDHHAAIVRDTAIAKALEVLLWGFWPSVHKIRSLRLGTEKVADGVLAVQFSLKIDYSPRSGDLLGLLIRLVSG